jgi:hypothetical protein
MKTMKTLLAAMLLLLPLCLDAQTRAETRLYGNTMKKPTVKAADKFLKKYPNSVYAPKVLQMKDSLLYIEYVEANISQIPKESARSVMGEALDAVGWKKDKKDHVLALDKDLSLKVLSPDGTLQEVRNLQVYTLEETPDSLILMAPLEVIKPLSARRNYVHFAYRNGDKEYVEALYLPDEDLLYQALFYGKPLEPGTFKIEGQSPEMMEGTLSSAEMAWLVEKLKENPALVPISKADLLTDESIRWWLEKNPKAETTATQLAFGRLDPESSIAEACKQARKERGKTCSVAQVDIRGYTVLCEVERSTGECTLIWCEPICKDKRTDKYIRSFYFENDGTTLDVVYYKGKTTFKHKISLPSRKLGRFK